MPRRIDLIAIFPPGAIMEQEGLGRYIDSLVEGSKENTSWTDDFEVILNVAPWHYKWGEKVVENSCVQIRKCKTKTFSGILLNLWSLSKDKRIEKKEFLQGFYFNRQIIVWTLHKWSAGIVPVRKSNLLGKCIAEGLSFLAKSVLWTARRLKNREMFIVHESEEVKTGIMNARRSQLHVIFDMHFRRLANSMIVEIGKKSDLMIYLHNRLPIASTRARILVLVPDLIPLEYAKEFEDYSPRWTTIQSEIAETGLKSNKWVTFSNHTLDFALSNGLQSSESGSRVIRHANTPPSRAWKEFYLQQDRGVGKQWVDYWWRSGLMKATNSLFRNVIFNNQISYCIYPTQFRPHKNLELLIKEWQKVLQQYPDYKLVLTANPEQNTNLRALVRSLELELSVIFLPNLSDSELVAWTTRADLVISASKAEGAMPFMVSEAMAAQVPFLVLNLPVSREVLPKELQEISLMNPNEIAQSIKKSLKSREDITSKQLAWHAANMRDWNDVWSDWISAAVWSLNE